MSPEEVAKTWIWRELTDLFFAFDVYDSERYLNE